jgi:thiamine-phosphate pyrophosphorylase
MIYALCDRDLLDSKGVSLEEYVQICSSKDVAIIQYRDKHSSLEAKKANLLKLRSLWSGKLVINDELSLVEYCDGLHIGQEDMQKYSNDPHIAISMLREKIGTKLLGLSTHDQDEIAIANELDLDYIGLGAYRATSTKTDVSTILGDRLPLLAKLSTHPVGAIGGVKCDEVIEGVTYNVVGSDLL